MICPRLPFASMPQIAYTNPAATGSAAITGLSPKYLLSVVSERNAGADQCNPPSEDLLVTMARRSVPEATQMKYNSPFGLNESHGSELPSRPCVPPLQKDSPGISTCCQRLPPSRLTAAPMPLKCPPIQATTRFFGLVGLTATEH